MPDRDSVINDLNVTKLILCNPQMLTPEMCIRIGQAITSALHLLKERDTVVRCKDCKHFEPDGIYTMCYRHNGLSQNTDWFCADGERAES